VKFKKNGVYWLTPSGISDTRKLVSLAGEVLNGGVCMVQYREKSLTNKKRYDQALQLKKICAAYNVPFIVNDCLELAQSINADGVHIGKEDSSLELARSALGEKKIIGVSCYNDLDKAKKIVRNGADYIALGRFHPSKTKPNAPTCSLEILKNAANKISIPIIAIGGINLDNAPNLIRHGATHIAIIDAISKAKCSYLATKRLSKLF